MQDFDRYIELAEQARAAFDFELARQEAQHVAVAITQCLAHGALELQRGCFARLQRQIVDLDWKAAARGGNTRRVHVSREAFAVQGR